MSELLRLGSLKSVYHRTSTLLTLKELARSYSNLVEDSTRVMPRERRSGGARRRTPGSCTVMYEPERWPLAGCRLGGT